MRLALIVGVPRSHTQTYTPGSTPHEQVSSPLHSLQPTRHTTNTTDKRPCPQRDSNPQWEQTRAADVRQHGHRDRQTL